jgi:hypothetical protein
MQSILFVTKGRQNKQLSLPSVGFLIEQHVLDTNAGKQLSEAAQMSNLHCCRKNERHLNIDYSFDHKMSQSKSKCWYTKNCLNF